MDKGPRTPEPLAANKDNPHEKPADNLFKATLRRIAAHSVKVIFFALDLTKKQQYKLLFYYFFNLKKKYNKYKDE